MSEDALKTLETHIAALKKAYKAKGKNRKGSQAKKNTPKQDEPVR